MNVLITEALDKAISEHDFAANNNFSDKSDSANAAKPPVGDLIDLSGFDRSKNKVYASVAEMKRSKVSPL